VLRQFSSVMCIARALKPLFCPGGAAAARLDAFFAMIASLMMQPEF
jgi:hypothetical protein